MGQPAENFKPEGFVPEPNRSIPVSGPLSDNCKNVPLSSGQDEPFLSGRPIFDNPNLPQGGCHLRLVSGKSPKGPVQVQGSGAQKPPKPPGAPPVASEEPEETPSLGSTHIEDITKASQARVEQILAKLVGPGAPKTVEQAIGEEAKKVGEILKTFVEQFQVEKNSPRIIELEAENKKLWEMFLTLTDEVKKLRQENAKLKGTA